MKIISPFHDYYDSAMAYGSDPLAIYKRETSLLPAVGIDGLDDQAFPWNTSGGYSRAGVRHLQLYHSKLNVEGVSRWSMSPHRYSGKIMNLSEGFLIVAGKAYPVWLKDELISNGILNNKATDGWSGTPTQSDAEKRFEHNLIKRYEGAEAKSREVQDTGWNNDRSKKAYDQAKEKLLAQDFTNFHLAVGAPVALIVDVRILGYMEKELKHPFEQERLAGRGVPSAIILNPRMADLNMAHALDPALAFQEISQFVCGVAPGQQMPMVELADKSKIEKKGFDPKYGFRTRPKIK